MVPEAGGWEGLERDWAMRSVDSSIVVRGWAAEVESLNSSSEMVISSGLEGLVLVTGTG